MNPRVRRFAVPASTPDRKPDPAPIDTSKVMGALESAVIRLGHSVESNATAHELSDLHTDLVNLAELTRAVLIAVRTHDCK